MLATTGPGPASSDRDRRVMETELDDRALQDGVADKAVAGYLYFPVGETKATNMELVYQHDKGELKLPLLLAEKEVATARARSACARPRKSRSTGRVVPIAQSAAVLVLS